MYVSPTVYVVTRLVLYTGPEWSHVRGRLARAGVGTETAIGLNSKAPCHGQPLQLSVRGLGISGLECLPVSPGDRGACGERRYVADRTTLLDQRNDVKSPDPYPAPFHSWRDTMTKSGLKAIERVIRNRYPAMPEIDVMQFTSEIATALHDAEVQVREAVNAA